MPKTIGIMVAMDSELKLFIDNFNAKKEDFSPVDFYTASAANNNLRLVIVKSGIGKVNAAIAATLLCQIYKPDIIVTSGVCGSLSKSSVSQGDIHITSTVRYHDVWCGEPNVPGQIQDMPSVFRLVQFSDVRFVQEIEKEFNDDKRKVWWGPTISGDWFVDDIKKAKTLLADHSMKDIDYISVDMETGAIAQVCHRFGTRCVSVRIVSDAILNPDCKKYEEFWSNAGQTLHNLLLSTLENINYGHIELKPKFNAEKIKNEDGQD